MFDAAKIRSFPITSKFFFLFLWPFPIFFLILPRTFYAYSLIMEIAIQRNESDIVDSYWEKLQSLSMKAKLKLAALLTTAAFEEECQNSSSTIERKEVKVKRRAENVPSDAQLEARFEGMSSPEIPQDPSWSEVISSNTGKTIQPIEKWL